jgi:hypothetical protein
MKKAIASKTTVEMTTAAQRMLWGSQMYMTGQYTFEQIAERLSVMGMKKVTVSQISQDLSYLRKTWLDMAVKNIEEVTAKEAAKLDMLEAAAFENLQMNPAYRDKYVDVMLRIATRRANLFGLDKAKTVNLKVQRPAVPRAQELTDEELEHIALTGKTIELKQLGDGTFGPVEGENHGNNNVDGELVQGGHLQREDELRRDLA